jgi:hypothetical protein
MMEEMEGMMRAPPIRRPREAESTWMICSASLAAAAGTFGPVLVATVHPVVYIRNKIYVTLVSMKKNTKKKDIKLTYDVSFGTNFVTAVHPVAYTVDRTYVTLVSMKKT